MKKYTPSKNQQDFYDFIVNSDKNAVIDAVAGSGKTTTLVESTKLIPKDKTLLFTAFNKSIAKELKERVSGDNITVSTVHGLGYNILSLHFNPEIDNLKYNKLLYEIALNNKEALNKYNFITTIKSYVKKIYDIFKNKDVEIKQYNKNVIAISNFGRLFYINLENKQKGIKELNKIARDYGLQNSDDESQIAFYLIKIGASITSKIDFTDMIFLPVLLNLQTQKYDYVYVDECLPIRTQILTQYGSVRIKKLLYKFTNKKPLPLVVTYNEETKEYENKRILNIWSNGIKDIYYVLLNNKRKIKSTVNHKFLTTDGWKRLDELKIGDEIINDRGVVKTLVTQEFTYHNTEEVFDMTVEDNHNFIILSTMSNYGIIAHNCQDLNTTQRLLIESSINTDGGRFVFIGDKKQNIYKFCGSNTESFDYLCKKPNTITLPLSVTYRCPPTIVNMVKHLNPNIVSHTNIDNGKIYNEYSYKNLRDGDMVLCRETFPLVSLCIRLFSEGRKSIIIGSDIGLSICRLISDLEKKNEEFTMEYVFSQLYYTKNKLIEKLELNNHITKSEASKDSTVILLDEKIKIIEAITNENDKPIDVIRKIEKLFSDEDKTGIVLATIHKSKGLESDRVFILHQDLMPSRFAKDEEDFEQEENLKYVAYTRSKRVLGFITDYDAFDKHDSMMHKVREINESTHIGTVGDKQWLDLEIIEIRDIKGQYGSTIVVDMKDKKGNIFSRFGEIQRKFENNSNPIKIGSKVSFYAIIKEHSVFNGKKITKLGKISLY
jgi:superfamily I DNA/RNA helicase